MDWESCFFSFYSYELLPFEFLFVEELYHPPNRLRLQSLDPNHQLQNQRRTMKTKKNQTSGSGVSTWQAGVFLFFLWDIQSLRSRWIGSSFPVFVAGNGRGVVVLIVVDVVVVVVVVCIALVLFFVFLFNNIVLERL